VLLHPVLVLQFQIGFQVDIAIPEVFVGGLLGSMLIFLFSAWACAAVGRTAQEVVKEVRRQFIERPGIMVSINFFSNLCIVP
jgi:Na+/H+-translocating membrane pyrophosphatase